MQAQGFETSVRHLVKRHQESLRDTRGKYRSMDMAFFPSIATTLSSNVPASDKTLLQRHKFIWIEWESDVEEHAD